LPGVLRAHKSKGQFACLRRARRCPACRPSRWVCRITAPEAAGRAGRRDSRHYARAGEHLRETLLARGCAADPHAMVEAAVGAGHLRAVAGGWAPDAAGLLAELRPPPHARGAA